MIIADIKTIFNFNPGLVLILLSLIVPILGKKWAAFWAILVSLISFILSFWLLIKGEMDGFRQAFVLVFAFIALIGEVYSKTFSDKVEKMATLVYAGGSISVVLAENWISLIFFWELMAVSSMAIIWSNRSANQEAENSAFRYILMHLLSGNLVLIGAIVVIVQQGNTDIIPLSGQYNLGFWLILIGAGINAGIPPLHTWIPDSYPEATLGGGIFLSSYTTKVGLFLLLLVFNGVDGLVILGSLMAVFGVIMAFLENDMRRLLSYHIVSQVGMMMAAVGTTSPFGVDGAIFHAINNILYKGLLLMVVSSIIYATGKRRISDLYGMAKEFPLLGICFLVGSLAIAGFPFTSGFESKALISQSLLSPAHQLPSILINLAGIGTWLSITMKMNYFIFFRKPPENRNPIEIIRKIPLTMYFSILITTLIVILIGFKQDLIYEILPYSGGREFGGASKHISEYLAIFGGASIPFVLLLKYIAPHDTITTDFDWFYKNWLPKAVYGTSRLIENLFSGSERIVGNFNFKVMEFLNKPNKVTDERGQGLVPFSYNVVNLMIILVIAFIIIISIDIE